MKNSIKIIQPDDWHVHFREGEMLSVVTKYSSRVNRRCIAMPNTSTPITNSLEAINYKNLIQKHSYKNNFEALIPCYLTDNLDVDDFEYALQNHIFIGGKLYPNNATTNSQYGVNDIKKIYNIFEILEKHNKTLLIHGELNRIDIDIFDREKYFIDEELYQIRNSFKDLKIVLEHVSSDYGVDFVKTNNNIAGTITPHHMLLTKKDVFKYLYESDLFLSTSLYEGHPISILEAMSIGLPIIASEVTGNIDTIKNGDSGFFYELGDINQAVYLIEKILKNKKLRLKFSNNSFLTHRKLFTTTKMKNSYLSLYKKYK